MRAVVVQKYFEYPYIPRILSFGSDSLLNRLRISEDGQIRKKTLKKIIDNLFILTEDIKEGDVLEAGIVTVNESDIRVIGYSAVLSVVDNNIILSNDYLSISEALLEYQLAKRGKLIR